MQECPQHHGAHLTTAIIVDDVGMLLRLDASVLHSHFSRRWPTADGGMTALYSTICRIVCMDRRTRRVRIIESHRIPVIFAQFPV